VRSGSQCRVVEYSIEPTSFENNTEELARALKKSDLLIVAGGDGTASIAANAILQSDVKDAKMAVFGYGNFNDYQSNFGLKKKHLEQVLQGKRRSTVVRPAEISLDGKFWRFATLYFTAGLLAKSTQVFEEKKVRATISRKRGLRRLIYSLWQLMFWFVRETSARKKENIIEVNGRKATDFGVMNGRKMAKILRNRKNYLDSWQVGAFRAKLTNLIKAGFFVIGGTIFGVATEGYDETVWELSARRGLWLQTEGEGHYEKSVQKIEAKKSERTIEIIT
jgi:hypothetical protein